MKRILALGFALALVGCGGGAKESSGGTTTAAGAGQPQPGMAQPANQGTTGQQPGTMDQNNMQQGGQGTMGGQGQGTTGGTTPTPQQ